MGRRVSGHVAARLAASVRQQRRKTLFRMLSKRDGVVRCFCCGEPVPERDATLEHKLPVSRGGTDDMSNLAISHSLCNQQRGNRLEPYDGQPA